MDKEMYLFEIKNGFKEFFEGEVVIEEIESYIEYYLFYFFQEGKSEVEVMQILLQVFGMFVDIVFLFKKEQFVMFCLFLMFYFFCNSVLFVVGIIIIMMYVWFELLIVYVVWKGIFVFVWLILVIYIIYWVLIGY